MVQAEDLTARQWAKANAGLEPSRSILESGVRRTGVAQTDGLLDAPESARRLGDEHPGRRNPDVRRSPHTTAKRSPACSGFLHPRIDRPGPLPDTRLSRWYGDGLSLVKVDRGALFVRRVEGVVDVVGDGLSWSPDDGKLAFVARRAGADSSGASLSTTHEVNPSPR